MTKKEPEREQFAQRDRRSGKFLQMKTPQIAEIIVASC